MSSSLIDIVSDLERWARTDPDDPKLRTRRRILEAATARFVDQGYRKTNMEEIARDAGIAKGTVYLYFESKAVLLFHAIAEEKRRHIGALLPFVPEAAIQEAHPAPSTAFMDSIEPASEDVEVPEDPVERLEAYLTRVFELIPTMPLTGRLMDGDRELLLVFEDLGADTEQQLRASQRLFVTILLSQLPGIDPASVYAKVSVLLSLFHATRQLMDPRLLGETSPHQHARALARTITRGILA